MSRDLGTAIAVFFVSFFFLYSSRGLPLFVSGGYPGPSFFPLILSFVLISCGILLVVNSLKSSLKDKPTGIEKWNFEKFIMLGDIQTMKNVIVFIFLTVLYISLIPLLGFTLTALVYLLVLQVIYGVSIVRAMLISVGLVLFIHVLFVMILNVVFPEPVLGPILWRWML